MNDNISARRDIVLLSVIAAGAAALCVKFNLSEALLRWTRPFERLQLDELPAVLLVIAVGLVWFSTRRYAEANRQLRMRTMVEGRLEQALAENKRLAQQYIDIQESERKALARDLHDEMGQYLNAIKLDAVSIRDARAAHPSVQEAARTMIVNIDRVYRSVSGLIRRLRPVGLDELGIAAALEHCVEEWRSRHAAARIEMSMVGDFETLDEARGLVVYRLVQEALTNIARHSRARNIQIRIAHEASAGARARRAGTERNIEILIADDGCGSDLRVPRTGLGLVGMRERVSALGGSVSVASEPGGGFKLMCSLPMTGRA